MSLLKFSWNKKALPSKTISRWGKNARQLGQGIGTGLQITDLRRKQAISQAGLRNEEQRGFRQSPQMVKLYNEQISEFEGKIAGLKKAKEKTASKPQTHNRKFRRKAMQNPFD